MEYTSIRLADVFKALFTFIIACRIKLVCSSSDIISSFFFFFFFLGNIDL